MMYKMKTKKILICGYGKLTAALEKVLADWKVSILNFNWHKMTEITAKYGERAYFKNAPFQEFPIIVNTIPCPLIQMQDIKQSTKKAIKELRGAGSKWYLKPFRAIGRIMDFGTERIFPHLKTGKNLGFWAKTGNFLKLAGHKLKGGAGIGRMIFAMAILGPILAKPVVKVSHLIFGKPTNSILDEDKEGKKYCYNPIKVQTKSAE